MKILLPTDFSENAQFAATYSIQLLQNAKAEVHLLNTWEIPHSNSAGFVSISNILKENSLEELGAALRHYNQENKNDGLTVTSSSERGSLPKVINQVGNREHVDLVIMGTRGASGIQEVLVGSNTASVIQNVNLPVLAIPSNTPFEPIKKILCAYDGKPASSGEFLQPLREIAKMFDAEVVVLNVKSPGQEESYDKQWITEQLAGVRHVFASEENKDVSEGINNYLEKHPAQMMVLTPRKYSYFSRFFHKSITQKMAFHGQLPLLALKDES